MTITGPDLLAANWIKTLDLMSQAGFLDSILCTICATSGPARTGLRSSSPG